MTSSVRRLSASRLSVGRSSVRRLPVPPPRCSPTREPAGEDTSSPGPNSCRCRHAANGPDTCSSRNECPGRTSVCRTSQRLRIGPFFSTTSALEPSTIGRSWWTKVTSCQGGDRRSNAPGAKCQSESFAAGTGMSVEKVCVATITSHGEFPPRGVVRHPRPRRCSRDGVSGPRPSRTGCSRRPAGP